MPVLNRLRILSAIAGGAAALFLSSPVFAQSTVVVDGSLRVQNGDVDCSSAFFRKAKGGEKIYGYSQSAVVALLYEYCGIGPAPVPVPPVGNFSFIVIGDPMNPNGGLFSRFPGLGLLNPDFNSGVPDAATKFDFYSANNSLIYTIEYDGFADFPQYPLSRISDQNPLLGFNFIVNFKDIGVPKAAKIARVDVKFSQKKPGALAIGDTGLLIPGKTVIARNKVILSETK